jgi:NTP pyrophosphatase (non-canonical NTP hydrolase)
VTSVSVIMIWFFEFVWDFEFRISDLVSDSLTLSDLQQLIRDTYDAKDRKRGVEGTFMWFMEEVGELSAALRGGTDEERAHEFADVLAWLATLANVVGVDLEAAVRAKYGGGCPGCGRTPCVCDQAEKP